MLRRTIEQFDAEPDDYQSNSALNAALGICHHRERAG
jgi:hypothetical protein